MNYEELGNNIQAIRKMKGFTQQELSDKIGINLQSLSKIERGINYPTYDTLEKIMDVLKVAPNELLSGRLKTSAHMQTKLLEFFEREERLSVELAYGEYESPLDKDEWIKYELNKLRDYITDYITDEKRTAKDLYPIKEFIRNQKMKKLVARYDDYLCHDMFGETLQGHSSPNPYVREVVTNNYWDDNGDTITTVEYPDDFDD